MMRILPALLVLCGLLQFGGAALAQGMPGLPGAGGGSVPQKAPPVKKLDGVCYPPESQVYKRITEGFIPFVGMIDCLKSGGVAAKR